MPIAAFATDAYLYVATEQAARYGWPPGSWATPPLAIAEGSYALLERTEVGAELAEALAQKAQDDELA